MCCRHYLRPFVPPTKASKWQHVFTKNHLHRLKCIARLFVGLYGARLTDGEHVKVYIVSFIIKGYYTMGLVLPFSCTHLLIVVKTTKKE